MAATSLYVQVHRRLVESGEWNSIFAGLVGRLNELGWIDDLKHHGKEEARRMRPLQFKALVDQLEPHAQASVPLAVKQEVMGIIRSFLEKQFES